MDIHDEATQLADGAAHLSSTDERPQDEVAAQDAAGVDDALAPTSVLLAAEQPARQYLVGSLFLYECHQFLCRGKLEWMHYVSGIRVGEVRTLDRIVTFALASRSVGHVTGDELSARDALLELEQRGHSLYAAFHSHRLEGPKAVFPSGIDLRHQERLQRGGYPVISAVFSDDGYIRFFTVDQPFAVQIYGKGVEQLDGQTFKLTDLS